MIVSSNVILVMANLKVGCFLYLRFGHNTVEAVSVRGLHGREPGLSSVSRLLLAFYCKFCIRIGCIWLYFTLLVMLDLSAAFANSAFGLDIFGYILLY